MERFRRDKKLMKCHCKNNSRRRKRSLAYQEHWEHLCQGIITSSCPELLHLLTEVKVSDCYLWLMPVLRKGSHDKQQPPCPKQKAHPCPRELAMVCLWEGTYHRGRQGDERREGEGVSTSIPSPAWDYPDLCKSHSNVWWKNFLKSSFMVIVRVFLFSSLLERTA